MELDWDSPRGLRASVCIASPRTLIDRLALAIFRAAPSNVRSLYTPAVPRQRLRRSAYDVLLLHKNLSGKLKNVKGDWGEGYPDANQCRLMVDRLCCYLFLQQQQQNEEEQPLQIAYSGQPSAEDGIFATVHLLRTSMGDLADQVLLLLFLMKGEGRTGSSADSMSPNSTPKRSRQSLTLPGALPALTPSVFTPSFPQQESLMAIHPLGKMQPSATSDLWLRHPSEHGSGHGPVAVSELFGALKPLSNVSVSTSCHSPCLDPIPSLPPLPLLPVSPCVPRQSLEDICNFYSLSISSRDISIQPLDHDPAFFFRAFADISAATSKSHSDVQMPPSPLLRESSPAQFNASVVVQTADSIWRDPRVLLAPSHLHCEPFALSPLMSMLPSEIMESVLAWLAPRHDADVIDEVALHRYCFSALIGVPSPAFSIDHSSCSLSPSDSPIRLEDVSSSALRNALLQFAHAGTAALRISHLAAYSSSPSSTLPFSVKSLICFARSQLLTLCQVCAFIITFSQRVPLRVTCAQDVLSVASANTHEPDSASITPVYPLPGHVLPDDWAAIGSCRAIKSAFSGIMREARTPSRSLLQLLTDTANLRRQLLLVASFCHCSPDDSVKAWTPAVTAERLGGHGLVDHLVYRSLSCVGHDLILIHSFLQAAFEPILADIARWVFCGEANDACASGGLIQLNTLVEEGKWGRRAWDSCVFVDTAQLPHMLSWRQFVYMVTVTGKSSRLLTKHAPDHFLAGGVPGSIPTLHFHMDSELQVKNADYAKCMRSFFMDREEKHNSIIAAAASASAAAKRSKIIEIRERRAKIEEADRQRILTRRLQGSSYLSELIVAANESKLLKKQQRDAVVAEEVRQFEMQQLLGQSSPDRLHDLMEKAKAQIVAEVADEFRAREQVESAFLKATSPAKAAPVLDIPQSTSIMAQLVVKSTAPKLLPHLESAVVSEPSHLATSVSPDPISDSTSIAALKARLAALQAARVTASAKLASSLSKSPSPAAPGEAEPSAFFPSSSSSMERTSLNHPNSSLPSGASFDSPAVVNAPFEVSIATIYVPLGEEANPPLFRADAENQYSKDRSFDFSAPFVGTAISVDGKSDADADASTVVMKDDDLSSCSSRSSVCDDSNSLSDESDESLDIIEDHAASACNVVPFDTPPLSTTQASGMYGISEVSDFMGTFPGAFDWDLFHASPAQWVARLSEAPQIKAVASDSQCRDDRLHAVNIVNVRLGILQPVLAHYDIACSAILSMMRREWCLDAYAQALQHFHLMEDGAFGDSFASALFDAMDEMPIQRMLADQFDQLLAHALKSSQSDSHPFAHKLRLRYASFSGQGDQIDGSSDGLDRLQLTLEISDEPAAIVLTKEVMRCYQSVFVLLLRLRRIIRVASRLFWDMPKERGGFRDPQSLEYTKTCGQHMASMRELTLFRHEVSHFAHTLQSYLMTQILHISVPELVAQQKGVRDLQQLIAVHTSFIENIMRRCLLNRRSEAVMSIIMSIMNVTLKCQALIRRGDSASLTAALHSRSEFHSHVGFLYLVLSKLVKRGYNLHLEDILLRLDFRSCF